MLATAQGTRHPHRRHQAIPRTLIFLTSRNPVSGERDLLLIHGAPHKRLWANRYNGLGGHVETGEDVYAAAERELAEEAGLRGVALRLAGIIHVDTGADADGPRPGVIIFVFAGDTAERSLQPSAEGEPTWVPLAGYAEYPLVEDLYAVIPRVLANRFFYASYTPAPDGTLTFTFREP